MAKGYPSFKIFINDKIKYEKIYFNFLISLTICKNQIVIDTGHANVSLVKNSYDLKAEGSYIGIKFELDKNWHTYWKKSW